MERIKLLVILISTMLFSNVAFSGLPGLETAYYRQLNKTRDYIVSNSLIEKTNPKTCNTQTVDIRKDGRIDITIAFGYMDVSNGQQFEDSGNHLYGPGNVLDIDAKNSLKSLLKSKCFSKKSVACGFRGNGDVLTKKVRDRWSNKSLKVTVTLASPAVTAFDSKNQTQKQQSSSARVKKIFLNALSTQDAVIYMGHARSGGGPDFNPPVLSSGGSVNYGHYKKAQNGIRSMLSALAGAQRKPPVIGMLACKSTGLFASRIRKQSPRSLLVTADNLFDYNDILPTGYAMLEAIISQRCGKEASRVIKAQPASRSFLKIFF